jgi:hypothetical protein
VAPDCADDTFQSGENAPLAANATPMSQAINLQLVGLGPQTRAAGETSGNAAWRPDALWIVESSDVSRSDFLTKLAETGSLAAVILADPELRVLRCLTQEYVGSFVDALSDLACFPACKLLRGLHDALLGEFYDAATAFVDWINDGDAGYRVDVYLSQLPEPAAPRKLRFPMFSVSASAPMQPAQTAAARATLLLELLRAYDAEPGNDAARWRMIESIALGLSKHYGALANYGTAIDAVTLALTHSPKSIHLRAAAFALECKLNNRELPARLAKFIGPDDGALLDRICSEPFKRFDITQTGDVLACCGHWLPTPIGNILDQEVDDILNSETAQKVRSSMLDGSYKYCNHLECALMAQDVLPKKEAVEDPVLHAAIDVGELKVTKVDELLFAFDQTCNLSCPSCRRERIVERPSLNEAKTIAIEEKIIPLLKDIKTLHINVAGEVFVSKPSRRLLELVDRDTSPDLKIAIISNGMLFTKKEWEKFPNLDGMIGRVRISTDAATKPTFEKLRRLAVWETFIENMRYIAGLRAQGAIPELGFSFTYQLDNFREMAAFVDFARSFNCDYVTVERLQNMGAFTWDEFNERAVHMADHPLHGEFLEVLRDPVFSTPMVRHDFEDMIEPARV